MSEEKKPREFVINSKKHGKKTVIVDEDMAGIFKKFTWHIKKDKNTFYVGTNFKHNGKKLSITLHKLVCGLSSSQIDHKNRNGLDNRSENLRFCSNQQNSYNRIRKNKFGYRGVYKPKNSPYYAFQIRSGKKSYSGYKFKTPKEAAIAYDKASKELHGEFGIRNFED